MNIFIVRFDDLLSLLPEPQVIPIRGRSKYQFSDSVDVQET